MDAKQAIEFLTGEWTTANAKHIGTDGVNALQDIADLILSQVEQIERMKCCENCRYHGYASYNGYIVCNLLEYNNYDFCIDKNYTKWEIL